jgi:hypothetical protein
MSPWAERAKAVKLAYNIRSKLLHKGHVTDSDLQAELPAPHYFHDINRHRRIGLRLKWWQSDAMTWRDAALSMPDHATLPATPIEGKVAFRIYGAEVKPVFFGYEKCSIPMR